MDDVDEFYDFVDFEPYNVQEIVLTNNEKIEWLRNYQKYLDNISRNITIRIYELNK